MNNAINVNDTDWTTTNLAPWDEEILDVIENSDSIEFVYKEVPAVSTTADTQARVFKIVFSCIGGKWHKSDRIYGEIIPAESERYVF